MFEGDPLLFAGTHARIHESEQDFVFEGDPPLFDGARARIHESERGFVFERNVRGFMNPDEASFLKAIHHFSLQKAKSLLDSPPLP